MQVIEFLLAVNVLGALVAIVLLYRRLDKLERSQAVDATDISTVYVHVRGLEATLGEIILASREDFLQGGRKPERKKHRSWADIKKSMDPERVARLEMEVASMCAEIANEERVTGPDGDGSHCSAAPAGYCGKPAARTDNCPDDRGKQGAGVGMQPDSEGRCQD